MSRNAEVPAAEPMTRLRALRVLSVVEGASLLALLFVAMPLKYLWGSPQAVRVVGMAHGVLFVALVAVTAHAVLRRVLSNAQGAGVLAWSMVPFGFVPAARLIEAPERAPSGSPEA